MKALKILNGISECMSKEEILTAVARAQVEMELFGITEVARRLKQPVANIRMRAVNNDIGTKIGKVGRVYSLSDVEALRDLIEAQTGLQPQTVKLKDEMLKLRLSGLNNRQIAANLGVDPSYVSKLLK